MKKCPICGNFQVMKNTGFCLKHHEEYIKEIRKYKRNFIEAKRRM